MKKVDPNIYDALNQFSKNQMEALNDDKLDPSLRILIGTIWNSAWSVLALAVQRAECTTTDPADTDTAFDNWVSQLDSTNNGAS